MYVLGGILFLSVLFCSDGKVVDVCRDCPTEVEGVFRCNRFRGLVRIASSGCVVRRLETTDRLLVQNISMDLQNTHVKLARTTLTCRQVPGKTVEINGLLCVSVLFIKKQQQCLPVKTTSNQRRCNRNRH